MRAQVILAFLLSLSFFGPAHARESCSTTNKLGALISKAKTDSKGWTRNDWVAWEQGLREKLGSDTANESMIGSLRRHYERSSVVEAGERRAEGLAQAAATEAQRSTTTASGSTYSRPPVQKGPPEILERFGSADEATASRNRQGLVPRPGHERADKWIAQPGEVDASRLGKADRYTHRMQIEVEPGTISWLKKKGMEQKPDVEPNRYGIPSQDLEQFNRRVRNIKVSPRKK